MGIGRESCEAALDTQARYDYEYPSPLQLGRRSAMRTERSIDRLNRVGGPSARLFLALRTDPMLDPSRLAFPVLDLPYHVEDDRDSSPFARYPGDEEDIEEDEIDDDLDDDDEFDDLDDEDDDDLDDDDDEDDVV